MSNRRLFRTGCIQKDLELTVKYSGIKIYDIQEVTDIAGNFNMSYEAFVSSLDGAFYKSFSEIASPIIIKSSTKILYIFDNECKLQDV